MTGPVSIAVIGDVHLRWDASDVAYFNAAAYDLVLFVGDLSRYTHYGGLRVARSIASLGRRALVMPGNHDAVHVGQLIAEVVRRSRLSFLLGRGQARRCSTLAAALGDATLCGYSVHSVATPGNDLAVIAGRPHSMGGSYIAYRRYLEARFGVASIEESARRLQSLVDETAHRRLIFFAHSGPTGLGAARTDIWGCDFTRAEGDWGDEDLRLAIHHARTKGKRVLAVVAGHMHHAVRGGGQRRWCAEHDGVVYVNAARVPRIFVHEGDMVRHHIALRIHGDEVEIRELLVRSRGTQAQVTAVVAPS